MGRDFHAIAGRFRTDIQQGAEPAHVLDVGHKHVDPAVSRQLLKSGTPEEKDGGRQMAAGLPADFRIVVAQGSAFQNTIDRHVDRYAVAGRIVGKQPPDRHAPPPGKQLVEGLVQG